MCVCLPIYLKLCRNIEVPGTMPIAVLPGIALIPKPNLLLQIDVVLLVGTWDN